MRAAHRKYLQKNKHYIILENKHYIIQAREKIRVSCMESLHHSFTHAPHLVFNRLFISFCLVESLVESITWSRCYIKTFTYLKPKPEPVNLGSNWDLASHATHLYFTTTLGLSLVAALTPQPPQLGASGGEQTRRRRRGSQQRD